MGSFVFKALAPRLQSRSKHEPTPMAQVTGEEKTTFPSEKIVFPLGKWLFSL
jgi:hypothetical protein